jgi:hypothetical protein
MKTTTPARQVRGAAPPAANTIAAHPVPDPVTGMNAAGEPRKRLPILFCHPRRARGLSHAHSPGMTMVVEVTSAIVPTNTCHPRRARARERACEVKGTQRLGKRITLQDEHGTSATGESTSAPYTRSRKEQRPRLIGSGEHQFLRRSPAQSCDSIRVRLAVVFVHSPGEHSMTSAHLSRAALGGIVAAVCLAPAAHATVTISSAATSNMSCTSGVCSPTAANAVLNVGDLTTMLASGNVTVNTGTGSLAAQVEDIVVRRASTGQAQMR